MPGRSALNGEEPLKREGCGLHGLHGAGRDHPVVTRKDFDEAESPPRSTSLAAVMRPGGEFGYFDAKRNLLSLTDSPWPGRHVCTARPGL